MRRQFVLIVLAFFLKAGCDGKKVQAPLEEEVFGHSVHPQGVGFRLPDRECRVRVRGVYGLCAVWDAPGWGWNCENNVDNVNNQNNANNQLPADPDDTERVLQEADLIRVSGDVLYALSARRGLVVMDISDPSHLSIVGVHPLFGTPFEMHVRPPHAFVQYSAFWNYIHDVQTGAGHFRLTSRILILDVSDPADIRELGTFDLPGEISDSRLSGDILYVVSGQGSSCDGCHMPNGLSVVSLNVADPEQPFEVSRLSVTWDSAEAFARRAVHFSSQRLYVGGVPDDQDHSFIQVVDISDPNGQLVEGTRFRVDGQITNRWQMDEHDGILRVVGQSLEWEHPPVVNTFRIHSSSNLEQLDRLELDMPRPEQLRSVRFEGSTAYIITAVPDIQNELWIDDPLFIVDCSDPQNLIQQGHHIMPGWVYFLEPRGDRLITLGLDNDAGIVLTLSLFDVSDPWNPREMVRNLFGSWSNEMAEDQSRIHKAMQVLDDRGLILVPYGDRTGPAVFGAVGVFRFERDSITPVATLRTAGLARRAFFRNDDMIVVGSEQVSSFDMEKPEDPQPLSHMDLAHRVSVSTVIDSNHVAMLAEDPWNESVRLEIHSLSDPFFQTPLATVDLAPFQVVSDSLKSFFWRQGQERAQLFSENGLLHVLLPSGNGSHTENIRLVSFDVSHPEEPIHLYSRFLLGQLEGRLPRRGPAVTVEAGQNMLFLNGRIIYAVRDQFRIVVVDVRDPSNAPYNNLYIPDHLRRFSLAPGSLVQSEDRVYLSVFVPAEEADNEQTGDWVEHHLLEVVTPESGVPHLAYVYRIPGSLVAVTPARDHLVTVDYTRELVGILGEDQCLELSTYPVFDAVTGRCYRINHTLRVSGFDDPMGDILQEHTFTDRWLRNVAVTQTRLFFTSYNEPLYMGFPRNAPVGQLENRPQLHVISLTNNASWAVTAQTDLPHPYSFLAYAHGNQALVVADAPPMLVHLRNPHPGVFENASVFPMGGHVFDLDRMAGGVLVSLGERGAHFVPDLP